MFSYFSSVYDIVWLLRPGLYTFQGFHQRLAIYNHNEFFLAIVIRFLWNLMCFNFISLRCVQDLTHTEIQSFWCLIPLYCYCSPILLLLQCLMQLLYSPGASLWSLIQLLLPWCILLESHTVTTPGCIFLEWAHTIITPWVHPSGVLYNYYSLGASFWGLIQSLHQLATTLWCLVLLLESHTITIPIHWCW